MFKTPIIRKALNLPVVIRNKSANKNSITEAWKNFKGIFCYKLNFVFVTLINNYQYFRREKRTTFHY